MRIPAFVFFLLLLLPGREMFAQSPDFSFGPRFGMGISGFSGLKDKRSGTSLAFQGGLVACRHITPDFALEFRPLVGAYESLSEGSLQDGTAPSGQPLMYSFHDSYSVYRVEFPLVAKFTAETGNFFFDVFAGQAIGVNMGGTRSRRFDDPQYDALHGYSFHSMDELRNSVTIGVIGADIGWHTGKGILCLDMQLERTQNPEGRIDSVIFFAKSATFGISWQH